MQFLTLVVLCITCDIYFMNELMFCIVCDSD